MAGNGISNAKMATKAASGDGPQPAVLQCPRADAVGRVQHERVTAGLMP